MIDLRKCKNQSILIFHSGAIGRYLIVQDLSGNVNRYVEVLTDMFGRPTTGQYKFMVGMTEFFNIIEAVS